ncbi:hypothetical protein Tco_0906474 [Tanacetum coccineum]|uniref:Uncharacterized protein n=1 Tax=Tanacetum coccineum TaxID=301880 RepID=A0ABQ5CMS3_9ASTR
MNPKRCRSTYFEATLKDSLRKIERNPGNKDGNRTGKKEESKAMVTVDGECVDWTTHSEDDENFAFMASNSSGSNTQGNARGEGNNFGTKFKASSTNSFSTARQKVNKQTVLTSTALKVNAVKPIVNDVRPANVFNKTHSPSSRPFKRTTVLRTNFSKQKVYTAKENPTKKSKKNGLIDSGCSSLCGWISLWVYKEGLGKRVLEHWKKRRFQMSSMGELTFFLPSKSNRNQMVNEIGALMYVTASRPDIMFAESVLFLGFQVTPKTSVSSFDLESYSDSDYAGSNLDRKSTTGGCSNFLVRRLITWQCKKQTKVATSTTEAEYLLSAKAAVGKIYDSQNQM